jgi:dTDP-4-dehydrorhamnose reductase
MNKTVVIFGSEGLLGYSFCKIFSENFKVIALDKSDCDITDKNIIVSFFKKYKPEIVINCASLINVEYCEKNPFLAWQVNTFGPANIAKALIESGLQKSILLQISSSDVFGDDKEVFNEFDKPNPVNVYGWSKYCGEKIVEQISKAENLKYFIVRTSWLYGEGKKTFVDIVAETLIKKDKIIIVSDQYNIPTYTNDFVGACLTLLDNKENYNPGIYHLTSSYDDIPSKYDIAVFVAETLSLDHSLLSNGQREDVFKVPRPKSAILKNSYSICLPNWKFSLIDYLKNNY